MTPSHAADQWTAALVQEEQILLWPQPMDQASKPQRIPRHSDRAKADLIAGLDQIGVSQSAPVLVCGLEEGAPVTVPASPGELSLQPEHHQGWELLHLPALSQQAPRGLMQTQVAQIAGFLALNPKWDGVICLPGAVTHWVLVSAAEVVSFQSALTLAVFRALAQPIGMQDAAASWSESALTEAAADTMSRPERLASRLAELQAQVQLDALAHPETIGRLWGYLIGADLAAARPYWLGQNLALIAHDDLASPYLAALSAQGLPVTQADPNRMALQGLIQARRHQMGESDTP